MTDDINYTTSKKIHSPCVTQVAPAQRTLAAVPQLSTEQGMRVAVERARKLARFWLYTLADAIPKTRQALQLPVARPLLAKLANNTCGATTAHCATLSMDQTTTSRLRHECVSRGVPLDSVLLASLFLAAAETVRVEQAAALNGGENSPPFGLRARRASVLGLVCLVMALLSGSAESKAMRYFCSVYAIIAGTLPEAEFRLFLYGVLRAAPL